MIDLFANRNIVKFCFWFLIGCVLSIFFYQSFDQPIQFDRAYLLYVSQVVSRGEYLYGATTFGYTPLSVVMVGYAMNLGEFFGLNTIESARLLGVIIYGLTCGSMNYFIDQLFVDKRAAFIGSFLFAGLGFLSLLSGINAEPKVWVLLFSIWGMLLMIKNKWFASSLFFTFAAMCWQVAVINLIALFFFIVWQMEKPINKLKQVFIGVFVGVLPVICYLFFTSGWIDFWNQAVIRKLIIEADKLGELGYMWLVWSIYPYFVSETFHFVLGILGLLIFSWNFIKNKNYGMTYFKDQATPLILMMIAVFWSSFNFIEFQSPFDIFSLIPVIVIFGTYFILATIKRVNRIGYIVVCVVLNFYCFFDAYLYEMPFSFTEQKTKIEEIQGKFGDVFTFGFEEYYTVLEKPLPTKFLRFSGYEDHMIDKEPGGCIEVIRTIRDMEIMYLLEFDKSKRRRSDKANEFLDFFGIVNGTLSFKRSKCATMIINSLTNGYPIENITVRKESIPFMGMFYVDEHYFIYEVKSIE